MTCGPTRRDIAAYEDAYSSDYDFELVQVQYRREAALRSLHACKPGYVIEIGCGLEPLLPFYLADGGAGIDRWLVVEPAERFVQAASVIAARHGGMVVLQGFFEDVAERVIKDYGQADMVICSGLLHEVPDPLHLLTAIRSTMRADAWLHVNVPNAASLHRRVARAMGLIADLRAMSARNVLLQQHRVYDLESLRADLKVAGLQSVRHGGILLKPFAHAQMQAILPVIGDDVLRGLGKIGEDFPELASEIFVDAMLVHE